MDKINKQHKLLLISIGNIFKLSDEVKIINWYNMFTKRTQKLKLTKNLGGKDWAVTYPNGSAFGKVRVHEDDFVEALKTGNITAEEADKLRKEEPGLSKEITEDVSTGTAASAITPKMANGKGPNKDGTGPRSKTGECDKEEYINPANESDVDPKELEMGIKVEMEHTDNVEEAKKIALQHLAEKKDYYTLLNKCVEGFKVTFIGPDGHQYFQKFDDEKALHKFKKNNSHLVVVKKSKERVGADPTQPLMEEEVNEIVEMIQECSKLSKEKAEDILEEIFN